MGTVIALFLVAIVVAGGAAAAFVVYKKVDRKKRIPAASKSAGKLTGGSSGMKTDHKLQNLRINDIVSYLGTDYMVEGKLDYREDIYTWTTYMLVDGNDVRWLSIEMDDQLEVSLWQDVKDLHVSTSPPEFLEYQGEKFRLVERGKARVRQEGKTGRRSGMEVKYYDYEAPSDTMLSVENWSGEVEVSIGNDVNPSALEVFPGDDITG